MATLGTPDGMALDAIILDSWAPDFDAASLIAELRANRPMLPILLLTANGSVAAAVSAMRAGATDFLVKPLAAKAAAEAEADVQASQRFFFLHRGCESGGAGAFGDVVGIGE